MAPHLQIFSICRTRSDHPRDSPHGAFFGGGSRSGVNPRGSGALMQPSTGCALYGTRRAGTRGRAEIWEEPSFTGGAGV